MNRFKLAQPKDKDQLAALLADTSMEYVLMAGGTDLLDEIKQGLKNPAVVVDLSGLASLCGIQKSQEGLTIGALTTISDLADYPSLENDIPGLKSAALSLATPQLRNVGTVGGNLCQKPRCWYYRDGGVVCRKKGGSRCFAFNGRSKYHAIFGGSGCFIVHPSDLAPMLVALDAKATLMGTGGEKTVSLEDFFQTPQLDVRKENILNSDQFLTGVKIPRSRFGTASTYVKFKERSTWDFAVVSAAVCGKKSGEAFQDLRIVMGGVAPVPWRLKKAEKFLEGKAISEDAINTAADEELKDARPLKDNAYKKDLLPAVLREAFHGLT